MIGLGSDKNDLKLECTRWNSRLTINYWYPWEVVIQRRTQTGFLIKSNHSERVLAKLANGHFCGPLFFNCPPSPLSPSILRGEKCISNVKLLFSWGQETKCNHTVEENDMTFCDNLFAPKVLYHLPEITKTKTPKLGKHAKGEILTWLQQWRFPQRSCSCV